MIRWATPSNSRNRHAARLRPGRTAGLLRARRRQPLLRRHPDDALPVDGLLEALEWANSGVAADTNACLWLAYLRWLGTQGVPLPDSAPFQPPRWIDGHGVLRHRRAPGNACLSGLATGEMGTVYRPVNPESKGCGTVMRSAPFGLIPYVAADAVYKLSADAASLPTGTPRPAERRRLQPHHPCPGRGRGLREAAGPRSETGRPAICPRVRSPTRCRPLRRPCGWPPPGYSWAPRNWSGSSAKAGWPRRHSPSRCMRFWPRHRLPTAAAGHPEAHFRAAIAVAVNHSGDATPPRRSPGTPGRALRGGMPAGELAGGAGGPGGHPGHGRAAGAVTGA